MSKPKLRVDAYRVADDAVERGIAYGWMRAHKHTDTPSPDHVREQIHAAVMNELSDYFIWP